MKYFETATDITMYVVVPRKQAQLVISGCWFITILKCYNN